jgi:hypothetical protein
MEAAGLKAGAAMTTAQMNEAANRLMSAGIFGSMAFKFEGSDLNFTMKVSQQLYLVRIGNLPLPTGAVLDGELHGRLPLYHGRVPSQGGLLDGVRDELEQMLGAEGIDAKLTITPYGSSKSSQPATALNFSIDAPPVRVGPVQLQGVSPSMQFRAEALIGSMRGAPLRR